MSFCHNLFGQCLIDAGKYHFERDAQSETTTAVGNEAYSSTDLHIIILDFLFLIARHMDDRITEASCIARGKQLFGVGRVTLAAQGVGQRQLQVKQAIIAMDRAVATANSSDFRGIQGGAHGAFSLDGF
ncbi:hypothetical protein FG99_10940 [Pseudomonas sp. AAC]|uniref:Uncharacterized protein n=1 Tax=Pseudomonas citronellolis TaxID=53408 RepID=A0A1A9KGW7_9PSED|nr:hypothetical protein A9C11_20645 [Pseudomonas citronellolis]KES24272.1 hypothetical protein FG99_10940 [Pseudomonas sp. AAC]